MTSVSKLLWTGRINRKQVPQPRPSSLQVQHPWGAMNMEKEQWQEPEDGTSKCLRNCRRLQWKGYTALCLCWKPFPACTGHQTQKLANRLFTRRDKMGEKICVVLRLPNLIQSEGLSKAMEFCPASL